jgi:hypothetical protein
MRLHEAIRSRHVVRITALAVALAGSALIAAPHSKAEGTCGATADDLFGTFVGRRTPPANAPDHADDQPLSVTLSKPNKLDSDNKAIRDGKVYATQKGSGTFAVQPFTWTEKGTRTIGDKSGPYEVTFKATKVECAGGTRVTSFTGTFTSPQTAVDDTESYARQG